MEKIYVLHENGLPIGVEDRAKVHELGLLHLAVQCWIVNSKGEVLIQRRAKTKAQSAGKWDVSFGGHCSVVAQNCNILLANLLKEGKEELGLNIAPCDVVKLGEVRYSSQNGKNNELIGVFLYQVSDMQNFRFEDGEVDAVKWISPALLYQNILSKPLEYANRLGAISLLRFYMEAQKAYFSFK